MLQFLTDYNKLTRIDLTANAWILASGYRGTWVEFGGVNNNASKPTAGNQAWPIWTESNRDGTVGWTPDVTSTGNVTIVIGHFRGITDQFVATPTVGQPLYVDANGKLTASTAGAARVVAICTRASYSTTYLGKAYTAIEFVTV